MADAEHLLGFHSCPVGIANAEYLQWQLRFLAGLQSTVRSQILFRLYPLNYGYGARERVTDSFPDVRVDAGMTSFEKQLDNARLVVIDRSELWDSEEDLVRFYSQPENFQKLIDYRAGGNVLFKHRVWMLTKAAQPWVDAVFARSAQLICDRVGADRSDAVTAELDCLRAYVVAAVVDALSPAGLDQPVVCRLHYDVLAWLSASARDAARAIPRRRRRRHAIRVLDRDGGRDPRRVPALRHRSGRADEDAAADCRRQLHPSGELSRCRRCAGPRGHVRRRAVRSRRVLDVTGPSLVILGITPARVGSKGIPRKNLRPVCGRPLIAWTIEAAKASRRLDRYVVSTEDRQIAAPVGRRRAGTPGRARERRSLDAGGSAARPHRDSSGYRRAAPDDLTGSQLGLIDRCVERFLDSSADSLATGFICKSIEYGKNELRRQDIGGFFYDDGNLYVIRGDLLRHGDRIGNRIERVLLDREQNVEIDDEFDLWVAERVLEKRLAARTL